MCIRDRASQVLEQADIWKERLARVPPMQADNALLILAAAAAAERRPDAGEWLTGLSRKLADFAFLERVDPGLWGLVERAAGRRVEAPHIEVGVPTATHPFAPPAQDRGPLTTSVRSRFEGTWPAGIPLGVRRSEVSRILTITASLMILPTLPGLAMFALLGVAIGLSSPAGVAVAMAGMS